jgi:hypothetical protein
VDAGTVAVGFGGLQAPCAQRPASVGTGTVTARTAASRSEAATAARALMPTTPSRTTGRQRRGTHRQARGSSSDAAARSRDTCRPAGYAA